MNMPNSEASGPGETGPFREVIVLLEPVEYPPMNHSSLLASILVRYPEIGTLKMLPGSRCIRLGFFVNGVYGPGSLDRFFRHFRDSIDTLTYLTGVKPSLLDVCLSHRETVLVIELDRDIDTISLEEISLIATLVRDQFGADLLCGESSADVEDSAWYEDLIQHMLEDIGEETFLHELIGFREGNRVLVYDKSVG